LIRTIGIEVRAIALTFFSAIAFAQKTSDFSKKSEVWIVGAIAIGGQRGAIAFSRFTPFNAQILATPPYIKKMSLQYTLQFDNIRQV